MTPGTVVAGYLDGGAWSACFGLSLRDMCLHDATHDRRMMRPGGRELRQVRGSGDIAAGRNGLAADFLDLDAEWLFMVDTDMGFAPDTVDRLVASADPETRPVFGALCFAMRRARPAAFHGERVQVIPTLYERVADGFLPILDYARDQVVQVDATGAACLLIHRTALERVREAFGDRWFDHITEDFVPAFSEDLSFCLRLKALGIPVHVDTAVKTTHHKGAVWLDEELFETQRIGEGVAGGAQ